MRSLLYLDAQRMQKSSQVDEQIEQDASVPVLFF
jgi:hypothetical protein